MGNEGILFRRLLMYLRHGEISVKAFCDLFETAYNFNSDGSNFTLLESNVFSDVFEKVAWYYPPADREPDEPKYLDEDDIKEVVESALARLEQGNTVADAIADLISSKSSK